MSARQEHAGAIGERIHTQATVFLARCLKQNEFGYTYLVLMRDAHGHTLKTFYSGRKWLPMKGQLVELGATVEAHEDYKGTATTLVTRATVKDLGVAPGFTHCEPTPIPRAEELRFQQQRRAQMQFMTTARGTPNAR